LVTLLGEKAVMVYTKNGCYKLIFVWLVPIVVWNVRICQKEKQEDAKKEKKMVITNLSRLV